MEAHVATGRLGGWPPMRIWFTFAFIQIYLGNKSLLAACSRVQKPLAIQDDPFAPLDCAA